MTAAHRPRSASWSLIRLLALTLSAGLAVSAQANPQTRVPAPVVVADGLTATVHAGKYERLHVPVMLRLDRAESEDFNKNTPVTLEHDGQRFPGQLSRGENGKLVLWWIIDKLAADHTRKFTIHFGQKTDAARFAWKDIENKALRLTVGDRSALEYRYEKFDPQRIEETKKPFHMVFDPSGQVFITKGLGGRFPHHRGIYFGYNKCKFNGKTYDTWHCHKGEHQVHEKVIETDAGPVFGGHTVLIHWNDRSGKTFAKERRSIRVYNIGANGWLIDFRTVLETAGPEIELDGDLQHAGVQFRATNELAEKGPKAGSSYLRPEKWKDLPENKEAKPAKHFDLPWNAIRYSAKEHPVTVAYLTDPSNPGPAQFSERMYGRFGEFFKWKLTKENPLRCHYQWWVSEGHKVTREDVHLKYENMVHPAEVKAEK